MDRVALDYLFRNRCIGNISYNDYEIAKMRRESKHYYSDRIINARQEINHILMNYTNYEHKEKLKQIDYMYNPQIQISAESETKRSIFREKDKTKRSKKESAQHSKSRNKSFVMTSVSAL